MRIDVERVEVSEITPMRDLYRQEMDCQIIHDSFARRGFSDAYLIRVEGRVAGYGLVAHRHDPETVHEFYVVPTCRAAALPMFRRLLEVGRATRILTQTNDPLLLLMLYDCATEITPQAILFEDALTTHLTCPSGFLREVTAADKAQLEVAKLDADSDWMIESDGVPVATGGVLCHYNPPYGDLYMAVHEAYRRRGYGSYLVQELKRIAYEMGRRPAARCNATNLASRRTLQKAGMLPCGRYLHGIVARAV
jgi:GNAT superfamily N-acetyltransferase